MIAAAYQHQISFQLYPLTASAIIAVLNHRINGNLSGT